MAVARNVEWLNQNALRAFPFREDTLRSPVVGGVHSQTIRIPDSAFVDFVVTIAGDGSERVYLRTLAKVGAFLTLVFADASDTPVGSVAIDTTSHTPNTGYTFAGTGAYSDARGRVVLGNLADLNSELPDGQWSFDISATEMETCTVRPALRGVRSISVENDGTVSSPLYGHVRFVAGSNIRLTVNEETNSLRIDARSAVGFQEECECDDYVVPEPIVTVNGINVADLTITGDGKCTTVSVEGNKLIIGDTCSKPCCGCPEQDFITQTAQRLELALRSVEAAVARVASRQAEYEAVVGVNTR